ncbi:MAG: CBS domain-containing protein, partial [Thermoplasmata archaeon]|nr:CBS domain-containing protein [Thermoplasmata archaeon]
MHLAEVARAEGIDLAASPVRSLIVAGEPGGSIPATRRRIEAAWGARLFDHNGMTEVGPVGIECVANPGGLHLMETDYLAEVIDPATSNPLPPGTVGELVLTTLSRPGSPLFRYRTGDLVRVDPITLPKNATFAQIAETFVQHRFQHIYITDKERRLLGAISLHDVKTFLDRPELESVVIAADIMNEDFPRISPRQG